MLRLGVTYKMRWLLAGFALTAILLVACGTSSDPQEGAPTEPAATSTSVPVANPTATPEPTATEISRPLTFVTVDEPNHVDWTDGNPGGTTEFFRDSFNDTLTWKPLGSNQVEPRLAETWEQVGPDEWVWQLRQDVSYHNGEKWNAQAAAHNLNLAYIEDRNGGLPTYLGHYNVNWTADDEFTLRQKCPGPCAIAPLAHTFSEIWYAPALYDSLTEEDRKIQFNGNGPYKFVSWTPGVSIKAEAFEDYWQGGNSHIPEVTVVWRLEEIVRSAMIQTGEADFAASIGTDNLNTVPKSVVGGSSEVFMIMLNQRNDQVPALAEENVRKALRHAVDCEQIVESFYSGQAKCQGTIFNEATVGNRPDISKQYDYDPELAQQLLADIDYANKYGATTDLGIVTRQGRVPHDVEVLESVAAFWTAIGVNAHVEVVESSVWTSKFRSLKDGNEQVEVIITPHGNEIGDGARSLRYINCDSPSSSVCNDEAQALLQAALDAGSDTREEALYQAFKTAYDRAWTMPLFEVPIAYGMVEDLDFEPRADRRIRFNDNFSWVK